MAYGGKVALVTGGGSGMGQLACRMFAEAGASVAALDINESGLAATAAGFDNIHTWQLDVTDFDAVKRVVAEVEERLGPIDRVYNAAAIMPFSKLLDMDNNISKKIMDINYGGLVHIAKATLPGMLERGNGDFVSFASMCGVMPTLFTGDYSSTKFAVRCYSETLYHENRNKGVRFACVCPPMVATPLLEQGKETAWPRLLEQDTAISPEAVLEEIERCLEKGRLFVYPGGFKTKMAVFMRRLFPSVVWRQVHAIEGW